VAIFPEHPEAALVVLSGLLLLLLLLLLLSALSFAACSIVVFCFSSMVISDRVAR
jgi:hypothetical protein